MHLKLWHILGRTSFFQYDSYPLQLNGLMTKSILAGAINSCSEGFWLAKHRAHKNPHHDGAVCLSSSMVFIVEHTPPLGASAKGVGQGHCLRVKYQIIN
jgi:hypothetical protein